jgi:hypothetical protein
MYLTEFDTKFDVYTKNDDLIIFIPPHNTPFDFISMSTEKCKIQRKTSWCNLTVCRDEIHLENIKSRYRKAIDFAFESHVYFYQFVERYDLRWNTKVRICIQIPPALQSLKDGENMFYSTYVGNSGQIMTKITKHRLRTDKQRLISISQNDIFQTLSMDEKKNLLALILSRKIDNFNLVLSILNLL